ncbi:MAG: hypothetical protein E7422_03950 [Ruminococcaceae bacterium]|nr:hypothetical protein [Oscillospiraceae bacterium]
MEVRIERDELGEVAIPPRRYWGARTERRRTAADAGLEPLPGELIRAFGIFKKAAARVNYDCDPARMTEEKCAAIFAAADELIRGKRREDFPLPVWQTGMQANDNVNEVIANRGSEMANMPELVRPEEVDLSLAPERAFPAAARIAAALAVADDILPAAEAMAARRGTDALKSACALLRDALAGLFRLPPIAVEGTAEGFDALVAEQTAKLTDKPFTAGDDAACELADLQRAHDAMRALSGELERVCEGEAREAAVMTSVQLSGIGAALSAAAARSEAERRTLLPLCAYDFLQSARLLGSLLATD